MTFIRLRIISEGQTEEAFVKRILAPHLGGFSVFADARSVLTSRDKKGHKNCRGGLVSYSKAKADIKTWMKEDRRAECRFTTMFDLYALPGDFPGYADARRENDPYRKVQVLEDALKEDIDDRRFIPYIQLHEFEALILADAGKLDWEYLDHDAPIRRLVDMVGNQNPELIDDTPEGRPIQEDSLRTARIRQGQFWRVGRRKDRTADHENEMFPFSPVGGVTGRIGGSAMKSSAGIRRI